jgi:putative intracellular protease/amidase
MFKDEESVKFLSDPEVQANLVSAKTLSEVQAADYDAVFYVGGHGPVIDLATDKVNIELASRVSVPAADDKLCQCLIIYNHSSIKIRRSPLLSVMALRKSLKPRTHIIISYHFYRSALLHAKDETGNTIFAGKRFTGFSNNEERIANKVSTIPFLLEDEITALGGKYESAAEAWAVGLHFCLIVKMHAN